MTTQHAYGEVVDLVGRLEGTMTFRAGGSPGGGVWTIALWGKVARVECRSKAVNDLDGLYESPVAEPRTWDDYPQSAELRDDAPWRLVDLVRRLAGA